TQIALASSSDSGLSDSDGITNDATPTITGLAESLSTVTVRIDGKSAGSAVSDGNWSFQSPSLADGYHTVTATATDRAGNVGTVSSEFELLIDTSAPAAASKIRLDLASDTGASSSDGVTRFKSPTATGDAESGSTVELYVDGVLAGVGTANSPWSIATGDLTDGTHKLAARVIDPAGNVGGLSGEVTIVVDTVAPVAQLFDLSATSDTGVRGDQITSAARVTLLGTSEAAARIELAGSTLSSLVALNGKFQLTGVPLVVGDNLVTLKSIDLAGNESSTTMTMVRLDVAQVDDPVLVWNQILLEAIRLDATPPPIASRGMAMVQAAVVDVINSIEQKPSLYVALPAAAGASAEAGVIAAAHRVVSYLFPAQTAEFDARRTSSLLTIADGAAKTDGIALGEAIADAMIALRSGDGWDAFVPYLPGSEPGDWLPTAPMFAPALLPQWGDVQPFALRDGAEFRPIGPPLLSSIEYASAWNEVRQLGAASGGTRTAEQTTIARFWADGGGTYTPPGHWNEIAATVARDFGNGLADNARLFAALNLAMADSGIAAWDAKYAAEFWRPITAIQQAQLDGNPATVADSSWTPLLVTPPFPEYVSGHSTFSGAAAAILAGFFGDEITFDSETPGLTGETRTFTSFTQAAEEAGRSRIYGGIHFQFSNADGQALGRSIAGVVQELMSVSEDRRAPTIILNGRSGAATSTNPTITGRVIDNLLGTSSLQYQVDSGPFQDLTFSATGTFSLPMTLPLNGTGDGTHVVTFRAQDAGGNISESAFHFTLDTIAPSLSVSSPSEGAEVNATTVLRGVASGTGSSITALSYSLDTGTSMPLSFNMDSGEFATTPDLSKLGAGNHTIHLRVRDAAGNEATLDRTVTLAAPLPFAIESVVPASGSTEVGVTIRPLVTFTRPVDPATLSKENIYVSDSAGNRLAATIVPANDGSFVWLFMHKPMPGASQISVTVNGDLIRATDGTFLDGDGNGTAGGVFRATFTTVSRTNLLNTSIGGILADPGPDLKPGTSDDVRPGPDGVLMTADDDYLLPIAGATLYILGREDQKVTTGADGRFTLDSIPAGDVKLAIDGMTATNAPAEIYFPEMVMDLNVVPGQVNFVMAAMMQDPVKAAAVLEQGVYLPRLQESLLQPVSSNQSTTITTNPTSAPNLTPEQRSRLTIELQPNSFVASNGGDVANGFVGISTVPPDLVRDMLPPGLLEHTFDITVQAPGISNFSAPAAMTFPNVFNAAPGTKLQFLSFDHTTGRLVIEGTATVSADGLSVRTDPDTGITHPGWHGLTPPGTTTDPPCPPAFHDIEVPPIAVTDGLRDYYFDDDQGRFRLSFGNAASRLRPNEEKCSSYNRRATPLEVKIELIGNDGANGFLDGLASQTFYLQPEQQRSITVDMRDLLTDARISSALSNKLYGAKVKITLKQQGAASTIRTDEIYIYRLFDIGDNVHVDGTMDFPKTFINNDVTQRQDLVYAGPGAASPTLTPATGSEFGYSGSTVTFNPSADGSRTDELRIVSPGGGNPGSVNLRGRGVGPQNILFPKSSLQAAITRIVDTSPVPASLVTFVGIFPVDSADAGTLRSDEAGFQAIVDDIYSDAVTNVYTNFQTLSANALAAVDIYDSGAGAGQLVTSVYVGTGANPCGNAGTPACAYWADFDKDDFQNTFVPEFYKTSTLQDQFRFDSITNRSYSDNPGGALAVKMNIDVLAGFGSISGSATPRAAFKRLLANAITHEVGHDLGAIHLRDAANNYIVGNGDVMGSRGSSAASLYSFITMGPLVKYALGLPVTTAEHVSIWDYYKTYEPLETYRHNLGLLGPHHDPSEAGTGTPVLELLDAPIVMGGAAPGQFRDGDHVDLGPVRADGSGGESVTRAIYLFNNGDEPLTISGVSLSGAASGFVLEGIGTLPLSIPAIDPLNPDPAASTVALTVRFDPSLRGSLHDTLRISSNSLTPHPHTQTQTISLALDGTGIANSGAIRVQVANNNLGGRALSAGAVTVGAFATVENVGADPLTINSLAMLDGQHFALTDLPTLPLQLAQGTSATIGLQFDPGAIGLLRDRILIGSDDPLAAMFRQGVVGTGLSDGASALDYGQDFVGLETANTGALPLHQRSDDEGNFSFFLPPEEPFHAAIFDLISGLLAHIYGTSAATGEPTEVGEPIFMASMEVDQDGDGLPCDIEFAVGTACDAADTDRDGIDDFVELRNGTDPLGGRAFPTGVVAGVELTGNAMEIVTGPSPLDPNRQLAYIAGDDYGLSVVDVTDFANPRLVGGLNLPGQNRDVSVDLAGNLAVVAGGDSGLHLLNVADPANPTVIATLPLASVQRVEAFDGVAYLASGAEILAVELSSHEILDQQNLSQGQIIDLVREGTHLYVMTQGTLNVFDISDGIPVLRGSVSVAEHGGKLFAGGGLVLVGGDASGFQGGFSIVDVGDPVSPQLLSEVDDAALAGNALAANGAGLAVLVGNPFPVNVLDLVRISDPTNTGELITRINLPAAPNGVFIGSGIAFVANGTAGLQVVNYLAYDSLGVAPAVTISALVPDADPGTPGIQVVEGTSLPIRATVTDDVQVEHVELWVGDSTLAHDPSHPFEFLVPVPRLSTGATSLTMRATAYDTGGNPGISDALTVEIVPDTTAPDVVSSSPAEGQRRLRIPAITLRFNEPLATEIVSTSGITLTHLGADGVPGGGDDTAVAVGRLDISASRRLAIYPATDFLPGAYQLVVDGSIISDRAGNHLPSPFTLNFIKRPDTTPLILDQEVSGEIVIGDESEVFVFTGQIGQRIAFDGLEQDHDSLQMQLISPTQEVVWYQYGRWLYDTAPTTLIESGTYRLILATSPRDVVDYRFRVHDLGQAPRIGLDTTVGTGLVPVPATAFTNLVGSYVDASLRGEVEFDDWRLSQTIAGTRSDSHISFTQSQWGARADVGLSGGSDSNWDAYSVQWDGQLSITQPNTLLYLRSAFRDGSRMLIDLDHDGSFTQADIDSGGLLDIGWGIWHNETSNPSVPLSVGTYNIRVQFEDEEGDNFVHLLWDNGTNLTPGFATDYYRFDGLKGQRLYFDVQESTRYSSAHSWTLYSAANQPIGSNYWNADFESTLPSDGEYLLAVAGDSSSPISYRFATVTPTTTTSSFAMGETISGQITEAGEIDAWTFTANAGNRILYDAQDSDFDAITMKLTTPGGVTLVYQNSDYDSSPLVLTESGTYRLALVGTSDTVGDYKFRILNVADQPLVALDTDIGYGLQPVPASAFTNLVGSYVDASLRGEVEFDDWRVSQTIAGTRSDSHISFTQSQWGARAEVGLSGGSDSDWDAYSVQWDGEVTVSNTGTHLYLRSDARSRLLIDVNQDGELDALDISLGGLLDNGWGANEYVSTSLNSIALQPGVYAFRMQYDELYGDNQAYLLWDDGQGLNPGLASRIYRFDGLKDQRLYVQNFVKGTPLPHYAATLLIFGPDGRPATGYTTVYTDLEATLPSDGEYFVVLSGNLADTPVPFQFRLVTPDVELLALTLDSVASGTIDEPGDRDEWTFAGTAGQRVYFDQLELGWSPVSFVLSTPTGGPLWSSGCHFFWYVEYCDSGVIVLPQTGTYRVTVEGVVRRSNIESPEIGTGDYSFRLWDLDVVPSLTFGSSESITLDPGASATVFKFAGVEDRTYYIDFNSALLSYPHNGNAAVYRSDGQIIRSNGLGQDFDVTAAVTSEYFVVLNGIDTTAIDLTFTVIEPSTVSSVFGDTDYGVPQADLLGSPGDVRIYKLPLVAGQQLFYDALEFELDAIDVVLQSPTGFSLLHRNSDVDFGPILIQQTGDYELRLSGSGDTVGDFNFVLHRKDLMQEVSVGGMATGQIDPGRSARYFRFSGTQGQRIELANTISSRSEANWSLWSPLGGLLSRNNVATNHPALTLPVTGSYVIEVSGYFDDPPALDFEFQINDLSDTPVMSSGFDLVHQGDFAPGEQDVVNFDAAAGLRFFFDTLDSDFDATIVRLVDPFGATIHERSASYDMGMDILPFSGTYQLVLYANSPDDSGDYRFRLLDLDSNSTAIVPGTVVQENAIEPDATLVYRLDATAGSRYVFDGIDLDTYNVSGYSIDGAGNVVQPDWRGASKKDWGPVQLEATTRYFLIVENSGDQAADLAFNLQAETDQATAPFDTPIAGTLDPGGSTHLMRVSAAAGQRLYFLGDAEPLSDAYITLYYPDRADWIDYTFSTYLNNDMEVTIPFTGDYLLALQGYAVDGPRDYAFTIVTSQTTTASLNGFGAVQTADIAEPGDMHEVTFTGSAGQRIFYDAIDADNDRIDVTLWSPTGVNLGGWNSDWDNGLRTLTDDGTYRLRFDGSGRTVGDIAFRLLDLADATPLVADKLVSTTLSEWPSQSRATIYSFYAATGERLYFDSQFVTGCYAWTVYAMDDAYVSSSGGCGDLSLEMPFTGQFAIVIVGNGTSSDPTGITFRMTAPTTSSNSLVFDQVYGGSFEFTTPQGLSGPADLLLGTNDLLYVGNRSNGVTRYDALTGAFVDQFIAAGDHGLWYLGGMDFGPDGNLYIANAYSGGSILVYDGSSGDFLSEIVPPGGSGLVDPRGLTIGPDGNIYVASDRGSTKILKFSTSGDFQGVFVDGVGQGLTNGVSPVFSPGGDLYVAEYDTGRVLRYDGTSGAFVETLIGAGAAGLGRTSALTFLATGDLLVSDFSGNRLMKFDGTTGGFEGVFSEGGPLSGPYGALLDGFNNLFVASYLGNRVLRYDATTGGCVGNDEICASGERDRYFFDGTAGQRIYYDALLGASAQTIATLYGPGGSVLPMFGYLWGHYDAGTYTLPTTGSYYIEFSAPGPGGHLSAYRFRVLDVAVQSALEFDIAIQVTLSPLRTELYRFLGTKDQRLYFDVQGAATCSGIMTLRGPANQQLNGASICNDFSVVLPSDGEYVVELASYHDYLPVTFDFQVVTPSTTTTLLSNLGDIVAGSIDEPGELDIYTFEGAVGQRLIPDQLAGNLNAQFTVFSPSGLELANFFSYYWSEVPETLIEPGLYQIVVRGIGDGTGSYAFRVQDAADAMELPLNDPTTRTLEPGQRLEVFHLDGVTGQELTFDATGAASCEGVWRLYGPANQQLGGNCIGYDFSVVLPGPGPYLLVVTGGVSAGEPIDYSFEVVTSALMAEPGTVSAGTGVEVPVGLTQSELATAVDAAIARWVDAGLPESLARSALARKSVRIVDLPGNYLGLVAKDAILIDRDAAGRGWFVDPTPHDDSEFSGGDDSGPAANRYDLQSVLAHELGHLFGLRDRRETHHEAGLMSHELGVGERRTPNAKDVDAIFGKFL
ncbi:MAG: phosphatase PAP2 family protein, partial [Planctomycetes bacterium]|nr:phosphatase PAP2 family protein [Planctomycetota bacterium]